MNRFPLLLVLAACAAAPHAAPAGASTHAAVEFCLVGRFDLGARLQGTRPQPGEWYPARWCVTTEDGSGRVHVVTSGNINADVASDFAVTYLPPDTVRIVRRDAPPDLEFVPADITAEAARYRRIDPRRLVEELAANPDWVVAQTGDGAQRIRYPGSPVAVEVGLAGGRVERLETHAELPLRGRVPVVWRWRWDEGGAPELALTVDGFAVLRARATWRRLPPAEADALWRPSGKAAPRVIPGAAWPARVAMDLETLAEGVYRVTGVRTGFHHLVVDTAWGLIVGDAPAGWVELPQIPPADLVPGLGISGLSERLIDYLAEALPGRPLRAVVLTHAHDDHAGGARSFAAAGAAVYAPAGVAAFLERALNRPEMPPDRLATTAGRVKVIAVGERTVLADDERPVELVALSGGPHVAEALGLWLPASGLFFQSDLHVPGGPEGGPSPERAASECWFARFASTHLPPKAVVLSSHSTERTAVSRLRSYLDNRLCGAGT